jgi:hypothetical protein
MTLELRAIHSLRGLVSIALPIAQVGFPCLRDVERGVEAGRGRRRGCDSSALELALILFSRGGHGDDGMDSATFPWMADGRMVR